MEENLKKRLSQAKLRLSILEHTLKHCALLRHQFEDTLIRRNLCIEEIDYLENKFLAPITY